jgi:hypothetical protein
MDGWKKDGWMEGWNGLGSGGGLIYLLKRYIIQCSADSVSMSK